MNKVQRGNLIRKITKNGDDFILGKGSLIIFIGLIVVTEIINYIAFGLGWIGIKSPFMNELVDGGKIVVDESFAYIGGISLTLSSVGSIFNIWGFILITRMDKRFIFPILLGGIFSIPNEVFVGAIFSGVCFTFLIFVEVGTGLKGRKEDEVTHTKASSKHYIALAIVGVVFVTVGLSISLSVDFFTQGGENYLIPILDVLGSSVVLVCGSLALLKNKGALLALVFNDLIYISLYIIQGVYAMSVTFLIYMAMNFIGFLGGSSKEQEAKAKLRLELDTKPSIEDEVEEDTLMFR